MKGISLCGECAYYNLKKHRCTRGANGENDPRNPFYDDCPLPDAAPAITGQWEEIEDFDGESHWKCNACGNEWYFIDGTPLENGCNYCPRCGAKMDGERAAHE